MSMLTLHSDAFFRLHYNHFSDILCSCMPQRRLRFVIYIRLLGNQVEDMLY